MIFTKQNISLNFDFVKPCQKEKKEANNYFMKIFLLSSFDPDKFINKFELPQDPTTYLHMYLHIIYEHLDIF